MMQCSIYDKTTGKSETFCSVAAAKKLMKQLLKRKPDTNLTTQQP